MSTRGRHSDRRAQHAQAALGVEDDALALPESPLELLDPESLPESEDAEDAPESLLELSDDALSLASAPFLAALLSLL